MGDRRRRKKKQTAAAGTQRRGPDSGTAEAAVEAASSSSSLKKRTRTNGSAPVEMARPMRRQRLLFQDDLPMNATEMKFPVPPKKPTRFRGRMRLTERDKQLLLAIGMARHLTFAQLHLLFFRRWVANSVKARLRELCGLGERPANPAPLERVGYFEKDGQPASAYRLTPFGRDYALELMPELNLSTWSGEANESLEHDLGCVQIFVELAAASRGGNDMPDLRALPFTWRSGRRLKFERFVGFSFTKQDSAIIPDVVIELPRLSRRLLVEYETGSQPVIPKNPRKRGSAIQKLERWSAFMTRPAAHGSNTTWY